MDIALRDDFLGLWAKYFDSASLPVAFYFTNDDSVREFIRPPKGQACVVGQLAHVRGGETLAFDRDAVGCFGAKKFLGFSTMQRPGFEYFLSYGIPDKMEGERYKKSPEIVREMMKNAPVFQAPGKYIVFKRWDALAIADDPAVVIFFERPDVISGLFTLAGFDEADGNAVIAPFGAGCATIVQYPYLERDKPFPRAVLGSFDVSARPCLDRSILSFAAPMARFERMVRNMDESFLITRSWAKVRQRIEKER